MTRKAMMVLLAGGFAMIYAAWAQITSSPMPMPSIEPPATGDMQGADTMPGTTGDPTWSAPSPSPSYEPPSLPQPAGDPQGNIVISPI